MSLYDLPDEILLIIFNYCNAHDLFQLNGVCKRFYRIALELLIKESNNLLVTGQKSKKFCERCQPLLSSYREKFSIYNNWKCGRYESKIFYPKPVSNRHLLQGSTIENIYRNRLQMTKYMILLVNNMKSTNNLFAFNRTKNDLVSDDNVIVAKCSTEILDIFAPCNDIIVTNHRDGSIRQWTIKSLDGKKYFNEKILLRSSCPNPYIYCYLMDVTPQNIVTGVDTGKIELWKYIPEENSIMDKHIIPNLKLNPTLEPYVHFITFDPTGTKFAAGISQITEDEGRFIIYDINKCCTEEHIWLPEDFDLGLYYTNQILWKEPNDIFYLIYDRIIKIDTRTHKVVQKWNAPLEFDDSIGLYNDIYEKLTCMSSDNQYAIMTGTSQGKLILWDQRKSDFIQVFDKNNVGFVDCLQFDSSHMYVAADKIYEFDFTKIYLL